MGSLRTLHSVSVLVLAAIALVLDLNAFEVMLMIY